MSKIQEKINFDNKQAVRVPLNKLRINEQNPRYISEEKFTKLVTSLLVFPEMLELRPIVADKDGVILGGNMRLRALMDISSKQVSDITALMGASRDFTKKSATQKQALIAFWTDWLTTLSVPVVYADNLTKEQKREFIIKDNASFGEWDYDILANDWNVDDLAEWGVDVDWTNDVSSSQDIEVIEDNFDEDTDEVQAVCKAGEIWQLGEHRLMCGDSTKQEDVMRLMNGTQADLLVTDPPYNINYQSSNKALSNKSIINDNMNNADFNEFLHTTFAQASSSVKDGGAFYVFHSDGFSQFFRNAIIDNGFELKQCLIWVKNQFTLGRQDYQWRHEPCLYGWKSGAAHYFCARRDLSTVIEDKIDINNLKKEEMKSLLRDLLNEEIPTTIIHCNKPTSNALHPTMKPVKLIGEFISNSSRPNENVLDLFGGSGTTLIACEQLSRKNYTMEYSPVFCDTIIARWEKFTGKRAEKVNG